MRTILKKKRIEKGLTQQQLADKVGIERAHYTKIELGNRDPSLKVFFKIKEVLEVNDDYIFTNKEERKRTG